MTTHTVKSLMDSGVHFGHKTQKWNPKMKKYIYGEKNNVHILNLELTVELLNNALKFVENEVGQGKKILFVGTKQQAASLIKENAEKIGMPYVIHRWLPGLLTNFDTMKQRIKYLKDLTDQEKSGELEKYTKKEISRIKKDLAKLEISLGGVREMEKRPDVVFVTDVVRDEIAVKEAKKVGIPVIAIVDTNSDPDNIDYPIPGNDDAVNSLSYLINAIKDVIVKLRK